MLQSQVGCQVRSAGKLLCSEINSAAQNAMMLITAAVMQTYVAKLFTLTFTSLTAGQC